MGRSAFPGRLRKPLRGCCSIGAPRCLSLRLPKWPQFGRARARFGRDPANVGRSQAMCGRILDHFRESVCPSLSKSGQCLADPVQSCVELGGIQANIAEVVRPKTRRVRVKMADVGRMCFVRPNICQLRPSSPNTAIIWPNLVVGESMAKSAHDSLKAHRTEPARLQGVADQCHPKCLREHDLGPGRECSDALGRQRSV